jgi:hypothetical protein
MIEKDVTAGWFLLVALVTWIDIKTNQITALEVEPWQWW